MPAFRSKCMDAIRHVSVADLLDLVRALAVEIEAARGPRGDKCRLDGNGAG